MAIGESVSELKYLSFAVAEHIHQSAHVLPQTLSADIAERIGGARVFKLLRQLMYRRHGFLLQRHKRLIHDHQTLGMAGRKPRAIRNLVPLLEGEGGIAWVCRYRIDERARVRAGTVRVLVLCFHHLDESEEEGDGSSAG